MDLKWACKLKKNGVISCQAKLPDYNMFASQGYYKSSADNGSSPYADFFERYHNGNEPCFLCVFATWCGHCRNLKDSCQGAWDIVKAQKGENNVLLLDSDKDTEAIRQFGLDKVVQGYPTVFANFTDRGVNGDYNQMSRNKFVNAVKAAASR